MRYPAVAGAFYERSKEGLLRQIRECYTHPLGPGRVPSVRAGERRILGLVVPHAGYVYSGPVAAHAYAALAADGWPSSFVILGPNHHGAGAPLAVTNHDWQTPLGTVPVDPEVYARLAKPPLEDDIRAHRDEHSIEVQLPFLQQLKEDLRFVAICMAFQADELAAEVAGPVAGAAKRRDGALSAAPDLTPVGAQDRPDRVGDDARDLGRMEPADRRDELPEERLPRLEDDHEFTGLLAMSAPPVDRFDGPEVRTGREAPFHDRPCDLARGRPVRSRHVRHRMRSPSTRHSRTSHSRYQGQEQEWPRRPFKWTSSWVRRSHARRDDVRDGRRPSGHGGQAWHVGGRPAGPGRLPDVLLRVRDGGDRQQPRRGGPRRLLHARGSGPPDDTAGRGHDQEGQDVAHPLLDPPRGAHQDAREAAASKGRALRLRGVRRLAR